MAGDTTIVDYASGGSLSTEGISTASGQQRCIRDDSLTEFRSCGQVENGTASTSPPYWDTDEDDDDHGPKPSALYGRFTWKIEKFAQISKRELRSNAFEVGGYKWYILIYPQGCDVCNHLSLFLCVANHDKLLPGWSHFAQFTIAVVNKDPKKSKYSDTLHRFWKKEHDWGWKKFMELSKVLDGFINDDSLVIKAQVQVIREKANRPFRCLDCQYRRELVRVYLSNVDQICRRFIEDRKGKFSKLIEDKVRWSSFRTFWLGINQITRRHMSRDKTDTILKGVVKHFFVEKEVTSTLVMDSLYSGLKALETPSKIKKGSMKLVEMEEFPAPIIHIEKDMFVLADDVLLLLERVALGPMPLQPSTPKDEKGSQNRTKDGSSGNEFNKDSIERDERRLTEFGRRVLEFFVVAHIFGKIEVAYQEAVALKRQEELIREEEAAEQAENELKARRSAAEKEKRIKKKQAKQRRNSRKVKDRAKDEIKSDIIVQVKHQQQCPSSEILLEPFSSMQEVVVVDSYQASENASDTSDTGDDVSEMAIQPDFVDRDCSSVNWDTDSSEIHPATEASSEQILNGQTEKKASSSLMEDSSSTCSTYSIPSVVINNVPYKGSSLMNSKSHTPPNRKSQQGKDVQNRPSDVNHLSGASSSCRTLKPEPEAVLSKNALIQGLEHPVEERKKPNVKDLVSSPQSSNSRTLETSSTPSTTAAAATSSLSTSSSSSSPGRSGKAPYISSTHLLNQSNESFTSTSTTKSKSSSITIQAAPVNEPPSRSPSPSSSLVYPATRTPQISSCKFESEKHLTPTKGNSSSPARQEATSRPSSAPLIAAAPRRPTPPLVSTTATTTQTPSPLLSRSISAAGRLDAPSFIPHSYRSVIVGKNDNTTFARSSPSGLTHQSLGSSNSTQTFVPQMINMRKDQDPGRPGLTFGSMKLPEALQCHYYHPRENFSRAGPSISNNNSNHVADEFPHLDIINDLLDEDKSIGNGATELPYAHHHHNLFNNQQQFSYTPADVIRLRLFDESEQFYDHQRVYGSSPHVDLAAYNAQLDGHLIQNQWVDLSTMMMNNTTRNTSADGGGYPYQFPDYSSTGGMNGYLYPPPGNGL